ncbi:response regulator transcription factor [Azospirillum sp.]|uniref:response regulator transcription factor n=1 Tax=Azospirillum sp. TaxID=34012 RepID=UPI002D44C131|nr:response regulator transcription factor [Azospirillum sp.]HYD67108.1 response regulator transcription factor [Azospirillum sp.]
MQPVPVVLLDSNNLFREGLKALLSDQDFHITSAAGSLSGVRMSTPDADTPQLVLVDPLGVGEVADMVRALKTSYPNARLVLLTSTLDSGIMMKAIEAGADGFLMKDMSTDALVQSLRLVMMGEKVFPSPLAALLISGQATKASTDLPPSKRNVSQREAQILRCLLLGDSNKLIAKHLDITEATVKVHLKSLLRKIDATNRTQAAIWGLHNGFAESRGGIHPLV